MKGSKGALGFTSYHQRTRKPPSSARRLIALPLWWGDEVRLGGLSLGQVSRQLREEVLVVVHAGTELLEVVHLVGETKRTGSEVDKLAILPSTSPTVRTPSPCMDWASLLIRYLPRPHGQRICTWVRQCMYSSMSPFTLLISFTSGTTLPPKAGWMTPEPAETPSAGLVCTSATSATVCRKSPME